MDEGSGLIPIDIYRYDNRKFHISKCGYVTLNEISQLFANMDLEIKVYNYDDKSDITEEVILSAVFNSDIVYTYFCMNREGMMGRLKRDMNRYYSEIDQSDATRFTNQNRLVVKCRNNLSKAIQKRMKSAKLVKKVLKVYDKEG